MPGPPPKPAAQRRRRNAAVSTVKLPAGGKRKPPPLPIASVSMETRAWWKTIWASPMAAAWLDADVPGLVRLARLVDRTATGDVSAMVLAEIRQLEDRFGLSPLARRRLQWEIAQADAGAAVVHRKDDKQRWLRAVSD